MKPERGVTEKTAPKIAVHFEELWLKARFPFSSREIKKILDKMCAELCDAWLNFPGQIECTFTNDTQMEDLNRSFIGAPGPTNTLAFEGNACSQEQTVFFPARLFFCVPQFQRECILYGQTPEEYAIYLLAHAMSHLAGLEHGPEMDHLSQRLEKIGLEQKQRFTLLV